MGRYEMGNSFGTGFMGMMMAPYQMMGYQMQTEMMIGAMLLVFLLLMVCCCGAFALCYFCYMKDDENRRRRADHREQAREDDMTLKTIQVMNAGSKKRKKHSDYPRYERRQSW